MKISIEQKRELVKAASYTFGVLGLNMYMDALKLLRDGGSTDAIPWYMNYKEMISELPQM